jgi:hypothetical protein
MRWEWVAATNSKQAVPSSVFGALLAGGRNNEAESKLAAITALVDDPTPWHRLAQLLPAARKVAAQLRSYCGRVLEGPPKRLGPAAYWSLGGLSRWPNRLRRNFLVGVACSHMPPRISHAHLSSISPPPLSTPSSPTTSRLSRLPLTCHQLPVDAPLSRSVLLPIGLPIGSRWSDPADLHPSYFSSSLHERLGTVDSGFILSPSLRDIFIISPFALKT